MVFPVNFFCCVKIVFVGKMSSSVHDESTALYRHYFWISEFIKYEGETSPQTTPDLCSNSSILSANDFAVPRKGLLKAYSKEQMVELEKHVLVAGSLRTLMGKKRLMICCVEKDAAFAVNYIKDLTYRRQCTCL